MEVRSSVGLGKLHCSIACCTGRCQHYETESTLWTNRVHHFLYDTRPSPVFSPRLRDKIWKWPGNELLSADQTCTSALWVINYSYMIIRLQKRYHWHTPSLLPCCLRHSRPTFLSLQYLLKTVGQGPWNRTSYLCKIPNWKCENSYKTSLYVSHLVIHKSQIWWIQIPKYPAIQWVSGI